MTLGDLDKRTVTYKAIQATIAGMERDLGGDLTVMQREIVQRACLLGAMVADQESRWLRGEPVDPAIVALLGNAQRRSLEALGLARQSKPVLTLAEHLARLASERPSVDDDQDDQDDADQDDGQVSNGDSQGSHSQEDVSDQLREDQRSNEEAA